MNTLVWKWILLKPMPSIDVFHLGAWYSQPCPQEVFLWLRQWTMTRPPEVEPLERIRLINILCHHRTSRHKALDFRSVPQSIHFMNQKGARQVCIRWDNQKGVMVLMTHDTKGAQTLHFSQSHN